MAERKNSRKINKKKKGGPGEREGETKRDKRERQREVCSLPNKHIHTHKKANK
jgi:hypothetical protein